MPSLTQLINEIREDLETLRFNYRPLPEVAKNLGLTPRYLKKLSVGSEPPVVGYLRVANGQILLNETQVIQDLKLYERRVT